MLRDLIYLGLGSALLAKEKIDEELSELAKKGKESKEEIEKLANEAKQRAKEEEEQIKDRLKEIIKEVISEMDLATKKDIQQMIEKLQESKDGNKN